jgi:hypothetical protein
MAERGSNTDMESMSKMFQDAESSADNASKNRQSQQEVRTQKNVEKLQALRGMENKLHKKELEVGRTTPQMDEAYDESAARAEELINARGVNEAVQEEAKNADQLRTNLIQYAELCRTSQKAFVMMKGVLKSDSFDSGMWDTLPQETRNSIIETIDDVTSAGDYEGETTVDPDKLKSYYSLCNKFPGTEFDKIKEKLLSIAIKNEIDLTTTSE